MSTCHIQQQSVLSMVIILSSLLMIVNNIIIQPHEFLNHCLLLACILTTSNSCVELPQYLIPIPQIIFDSSSARLIIIHVKNLTKIHGSPKRTTISYNIEHNCVRMVLRLDVFIHPHLTKHIHGLNTKTFTNPMSQPITTCDIRDTYHLASMSNIMTLFKRLHLTWAFTALWYIIAFVHPIEPGLSVHGPVGPHLSFGDADSGDSSTSRIGAVEIQTTTYFGYGS
ncbi:AC5 protein [Vernonia yellow vein virus]|uniref:AC5 protein n=1 Tax=Vernonia yellow vein virus TaxID=367061 RepID=Q2MCS6_9GEMI|nr:AC5 protein [Vernonia yellow vein virus]CAJ57819.2 AC5 protein [Vernonia yellow vein virus]